MKINKKKAKEVLQPMGENFFNCNRVSAGQIAKICNNAALGIQMISIIESMTLGQRLGIDVNTLNDIYKVKEFFIFQSLLIFLLI